MHSMKIVQVYWYSNTSTLCCASRSPTVCVIVGPHFCFSRQVHMNNTTKPISHMYKGGCKQCRYSCNLFLWWTRNAYIHKHGGYDVETVAADRQSSEVVYHSYPLDLGCVWLLVQTSCCWMLILTTRHKTWDKVGMTAVAAPLITYTYGRAGTNKLWLAHTWFWTESTMETQLMLVPQEQPPFRNPCSQKENQATEILSVSH